MWLSRSLKTLAKDASAPSFARGLALFGLAEVALARQNAAAAIKAWERLAADAKLLRFHRDTALRRIAETERLRQGLPARDPASCCVQLPVLPAPGKVFYVASTGSDTADGSKRKPFRTLERARDAVRSLKQSRSGRLPNGGVRIVIGGGEYPWERTLRLTSEDFRHRCGTHRLSGGIGPDGRLSRWSANLHMEVNLRREASRQTQPGNS